MIICHIQPEKGCGMIFMPQPFLTFIYHLQAVMMGI